MHCYSRRARRRYRSASFPWSSSLVSSLEWSSVSKIDTGKRSGRLTCRGAGDFLCFAACLHDFRDLFGCHTFTDEIVDDAFLVGDGLFLLENERMTH